MRGGARRGVVRERRRHAGALWEGTGDRPQATGERDGAGRSCGRRRATGERDGAGRSGAGRGGGARGPAGGFLIAASKASVSGNSVFERR